MREYSIRVTIGNKNGGNSTYVVKYEANNIQEAMRRAELDAQEVEGVLNIEPE